MPCSQSTTAHHPFATRTAQLDPTQLSIDMVGPMRACALLNIGDAELLALVNSDRLGAYRLGDQIHFRYRDVESLASRRAIAA
jgi:excisionase family DNA binding protein